MHQISQKIFWSLIWLLLYDLNLIVNIIFADTLQKPITALDCKIGDVNDSLQKATYYKISKLNKHLGMGYLLK